jgi:transcriptional regulator GlxA family with amidase domain
VVAFLRQRQDAGRPITAICHARWELVSAALVCGRTLTSYHTIQDDVRNRGNWVDREVVEDGNWVTSRQPDDLPAFNRAMLALFSRSLTPNRRKATPRIDWRGRCRASWKVQQRPGRRLSARPARWHDSR